MKVTAGADQFDTLHPLPTMDENPWSSDNSCGGLETAEGDDRVGKDVSPVAKACTDGGGICILRDKITRLEWTEKMGDKLHTPATTDCAALVVGADSDWRLPTMMELETATVHGISSVAHVNFITTADMGAQFWSSTHNANAPAAAWHANLLTGKAEDNYKSDTSKPSA